MAVFCRSNPDAGADSGGYSERRLSSGCISATVRVHVRSSEGAGEGLECCTGSRVARTMYVESEGLTSGTASTVFRVYIISPHFLPETQPVLRKTAMVEATCHVPRASSSPASRAVELPSGCHLTALPFCAVHLYLNARRLGGRDSPESP